LSAWNLDKNASSGLLDGLRQASQRIAESNQGVEILSANSVWCNSGIKESYVASAKTLFDAQAFPLPSRPDLINSWCSDHTKGLIPQILNEIGVNDVGVLVNAVYFKGSWSPAYTFDKSATRRETFQNSQGSKPCAMMVKTSNNMKYAKHAGTQLVELQYGTDEKFSAVVVLPPDEKGALASLVSRLGGGSEEGGQFHAVAHLAALIENLRSQRVELHLPRFRIEFGVRDLVPELGSAFGMTEVFKDGGAFLEMSEDPAVYMSNLHHKAVVEVNEEGTTAAAVSAGVMAVRSLPPPATPMVVDRPFLFLIRERSSGMLIFAGVVEDPVFDLEGL
jgi:serpin B